MDPYRIAPRTEAPTPTHGSFEDHLVELVLFSVGVLGVAIGLASKTSGVELTLGVALIVLVLLARFRTKLEDDVG